MSEALAGRHRDPHDEDGGDEDPGAGPAAPESTAMVSLPLAPVPMALPESVTCPECGMVSEATLSRRDSSDFCSRCDFPLFWTPSRIIVDGRGASEAALRRLPGTAGRVTVASLACPHCAESNSLAATTCVRCGGLLHPPPPVAPSVPLPPPPPPPEPIAVREPLSWWIVVVAWLTVLVFVALVAYLLAR